MHRVVRIALLAAAFVLVFLVTAAPNYSGGNHRTSAFHRMLT
jgi:hypothetical protein